jgi:hypothetical protein
MIKINNLTPGSVGKWVVYRRLSKTEREEGRIKGWNDKFIFVVYKCNNEWNRYQEFTAQATEGEDLSWKKIRKPNEEDEKRDKEMVRLLDMKDNPKTLEEVGQEYNVTRERVRQIYKRETGHGVRDNQHKRKEYRKKVWLKTEGEKVIGICMNCCADVKLKDVNNITKQHTWIYCKECGPYFKKLSRGEWGNNVKMRMPTECDTCHLYFHQCAPSFYGKKNYKGYENTKGNFCTVECYNIKRKENSKKGKLAELLKKYKVGDEVWFEECWEDESGAYHDECAQITKIYKNGTIKLNWYTEPVTKEFLNEFDYKLSDIAYRNKE